MRRHLFLLIILLLTAWRGNAQTMQGYEYWFDDGYGSKTAVTSGQPYVSFEADVSGLQAGLHYLNFRAQDVDGVWGALSRYIIYLTADSRGNSDMVAYEYWMDTDYSHRTSVKGSTVTSPFTVDVSNLQPGLHYFNFRAQCSDGHWGAMSRYIVYISDAPASSNLAAVDYWFDSNPTKIQRQQVTDNTIVISADISKLPKGMHTFYVEGIASDGSRGMLNGYEFEVEAGDVEPYAALSENNTVLTFYCDEKKEERNGMSVGPFNGEVEDVPWFNNCYSITTVVFDDSFANCTSLTSTANWFHVCEHLTTFIGMENLKTDNVTNMKNMFYSCRSLTSIDVSGFKTDNVTDMHGMFGGCHQLTSLDLSNFNTSNVTDMGLMFAFSDKLTDIVINSFNTENVTDMGYMFYNCSSLTTLDLSNFNTENVTSFANTFFGCSSLTSINMSSFKTTDKLASLQQTFEGCSSLVVLDLSNFNITKANNMSSLFSGCSNLTTIYASGDWNIGNKAGNEMFKDCSSLVGGKGTHYDADHIDVTYARIDGGPNSQTPGYFTDKNVKNWSVIGTLTGGLDTDVEMTSNDGVHFTASFPYMTIGSYEFKIRANASWAENYGLGGEPDGAYVGVDVQEKLSTVVVNFNAESHAIDFTVIPPTYSVVGGDSQGTGWLNWTDAEMTHINNGIYSATFENMAADTYMFKIRVNHEWDYQYNHEGRCDGGSDPATFTVSEEGSTVVISFNSATELPYVEVLTGPAPDPEPYAALSENNTVLTFYFDEYREQRNGMSVGPFENLGSYGVSTEWYDNRSTITTVVFDDSFANCTTLTSTAYWFYQLTKLTTIKGIQNLKTDNVNDINSMFCDCESLTSLDLSNLNLGNVTNMHQVFEGCTGLEIIIFDGVNTENVTNMGDLFLNCSSLKTIDLSSFNTNKVTNMRSMFYRCTSLTTVYVSDSWTTASVTESNNMFERCYSIVGGKGTTFDENYIDATYARIDGGPNSQTPGYFIRSGDQPWVDPNVGDAEPYAVLSDNNTVLTFYYDDKKAERNGMDVGPFPSYSERGWNDQCGSITSVVFDASFAECTTLTSTAFWFNGCENLTSITDIGNLRTDNVTNMGGMFCNCTKLTNLDVTNFNTVNVTNMSAMFYGCSSLSTIDLSAFNTGKVTEMSAMFSDCSGLTNLDLKNFNTENVTNMSGMFFGCSSLTNLDLSGFNTSNVTSMSQMFQSCSSLEKLDLRSFNTTNVTSMFQTFSSCSNLMDIDLSSFNTEKVTDMTNLFYGCFSLTRLNLSNFNTANVTNMFQMFYYCSNLIDVDISSFVTSNVNEMGYMFEGCTSLAAIQAGSAEIPAEEYAKIGNPNLLLYVNEARVAPEGVQNVVVNGVAKEIVLTDNPDGKIVNNNWYCPEPFRAEKISYTRDFRQQTQIGISRGWESLALPFAVQTITHQDKGAIAPFGSDASGLHFWLRRLGHEGLISVQMIEPNTPYIISMPNSEDYASRFNLNGRVTFAAEDAYVERTEQMEDESADYMMVPAFQRMPVSEYVYALNVGEERNGRPEGSIFERNYREVRPFEAYTLHRGDQPAPLFFDLSDLEGSTTNVQNHELLELHELSSDEWVTLDGRKLQKAPTAKGVYIYNGRKTVVK